MAAWDEAPGTGQSYNIISMPLSSRRDESNTRNGLGDRDKRFALLGTRALTTWIPGSRFAARPGMTVTLLAAWYQRSFVNALSCQRRSSRCASRESARKMTIPAPESSTRAANIRGILRR